MLDIKTEFHDYAKSIIFSFNSRLSPPPYKE